MTLGENKKPSERKYGTSKYWISYAESILALKKPWLSEVKCAEYGLRSAARRRDRTAIVLLERLKNAKRYAKTYQTKTGS
mgnify:CR=1 FL=1